MSAAPAPAATEPEPSSVTFKAECRGCGRLVRKRSRKALTWRCPHCARTNPGPGLLAELARAPEVGSRRRRTRREAVGAQITSPAAPLEPAAAPSPATPAPVRRRRVPATSPQAAEPARSSVAAGGPQQGRPSSTPAPAAAPTRSFWDRLVYGDEGD